MKKKQLVYLLCSVLFSGCTAVLNKEDFGGITPDDVWQNDKMIEALISDIHGVLMPGWPYNGNASDEASDTNTGLNDILRGTATIDANEYWPYDHIEKINFFLRNVKQTKFRQKNEWIGQALFWRAWCYFGMVKAYGGVPLILEPQNPFDKESLFKSRNTTTECFTQIIKDLDDAIDMLPSKWDDANYGRIDQGTVMAFKAKVLLFKASKLFNPDNNTGKWETAYLANKAAVEFLTAQGKKLFPVYKDIWYKERNEEVVMVNQFFTPDHKFYQGAIRPDPFTKDDTGANMPVYSLTSAYPMRDGTAFNPEKPNALDTLFNYRDDRFYATIAYNGCEYDIKDLKEGEHLWTGWTADGRGLEAVIHKGVVGAYSRIGFYCVKGLDPTLDRTGVYDATVDWIEIRFAEVLMNYGETANETGRSSEALQVLYDIRKRAGILPGPNNRYGITAVTKDEIREAYIKERFVEFAFENKRWDDLRRWKRFDILNKQVRKYTVRYTLKPNMPVPDIKDDIQLIWPHFTASMFDESPGYTYNLKDQYYFYAIARKHLERNSKLKQSKDWGGDFDPVL